MSAPTLYEIVDDLVALEDLLDEQAEADEADADVVARWLDEIEGEFEDKVDRTVSVVRALEARRDVRKREADRLAQLARYDDHAAARIKQRVLELLDVAGRKWVVTTHYSVTAATAGGKQPLLVDDVDLNALPPEFVRVRAELDQTAVRTLLESGEDISFARLGERGRYLKIR